MLKGETSKNGEILFVDKPKGISSFGVIRELRKKLDVRKMGHAGTLDPFATGLLIVGVGRDTKKLKDFEALPKTYLMEVLLGRRTDTGDPEGKIIEEKEVGRIDGSQLKKILEGMEGDIELPIPAYSAVKYRGLPLYKYARKGIKIPQKFRKTEIFYLKLLGIERNSKNIILKIEMKCEKGTYARSVAEEIGKRLGVPAMLQELRRTKIGDIDVSCARKLENGII